MRTTERIMMRFMRKSIFDKSIDKVLDELEHKDPESDDYEKLLHRADRLTKLRERERSNRVNPETAWMVAGNIIGILVIVAYEQKHVMASRGMNFILRPKS